jgi:hypothetical protein
VCGSASASSCLARPQTFEDVARDHGPDGIIVANQARACRGGAAVCRSRMTTQLQVLVVEERVEHGR